MCDIQVYCCTGMTINCTASASLLKQHTMIVQADTMRVWLLHIYLQFTVPYSFGLSCQLYQNCFLNSTSAHKRLAPVSVL